MIQTNTRIFNALKQMKEGAPFSDLTNIPLVIYYLNSVKAQEAAAWVKANELNYRRGLLEGFMIDNSQESQLKDLHNNN